MTAQELLVHLTRKQLDSLFRAARAIPEDRLDWQPSPASRSVRNQLQEIATAIDRFWPAYTDRKVVWTPESRAEWMAEREQIRDLDVIEKQARDSVERLIALIGTLNPDDLEAPVELPFPVPFTMADVLAYHYWNMTYHEGQINYIATLIEANPSAA